MGERRDVRDALVELQHRVEPPGEQDGSGAVRYLMQVNLVSRERELGPRRDYYRVRDDSWPEPAVLKRWRERKARLRESR